MEAAVKHALAFIRCDFTLKDFQLEVIKSYYAGKDCFCVAGTGAGKSLTYILCPIILDYKRGHTVTEENGMNSIVLIVQPLQSLMADQHQKLLDLKLKATYVGEDKDIEGIKEGQYNYIIASPESVITKSFLKVLHVLHQHIGCVIVDESHCIQTL
jgi:superfamily II DNA helicase RecQ